MKIPILPLLSLAGVSLAAYTVLGASRAPQGSPTGANPARSPFEATIAGSGIVEPLSQNVALGTALSGLVLEVAVTHGQRVERGALLFRIDDRALQAVVAARRADLVTARAECKRLESLPRAEELPPARALVAAAEAELADAQSQWEMAEAIADKRALSAEALSRRKFALRSAEARRESARAQLALLEAGAWEGELAVARARVAAEQAALEQAEVELDRTLVRAPISASVLQVNLRAGEYASATAGPGLIVLGDLSRLAVRVDIDENDAWRFRAGASARVSVRGNRELACDAEFLRIDPFVIPKRSLTGEATERVDTRVLQVLYTIDPAALPVYVGQQMDVFIAAAAPQAGAAK